MSRSTDQQPLLYGELAMGRLEDAKARLDRVLARLSKTTTAVQSLRADALVLQNRLEASEQTARLLRLAAADALAEVDQAIALLAGQASTEGEVVADIAPLDLRGAAEDAQLGALSGGDDGDSDGNVADAADDDNEGFEDGRDETVRKDAILSAVAAPALSLASDLSSLAPEPAEDHVGLAKMTEMAEITDDGSGDARLTPAAVATQGATTAGAVEDLEAGPANAMANANAKDNAKSKAKARESGESGETGESGSWSILDD